MHIFFNTKINDIFFTEKYLSIKLNGLKPMKWKILPPRTRIILLGQDVINPHKTLPSFQIRDATSNPLIVEIESSD